VLFSRYHLVKPLELSIRKLILLSAATILLSVSLVYGIAHEFTPKTNPQTFSTPIAYGVNEQLGLRLTLTLEKTEYGLDEPVNVTLTITNISNQTIEFSEAPSWWDFLVYNDTHNGLYEWLRSSGRAFPLYVTTVSLDPGMGFTNGVMIWPQLCNSTADRYGAANSPVSPGTYYIVGQYDDFGQSSDYNLETFPIQITIT
jgi:hypothetical protein